MANTYKSIGNTAAAVMSLLAIGTLCWWQRPVTPINAPRPQDEAEIMTAVLERHYAMGQFNVGYFRAVANGRLETNVTVDTFVNAITFTNGASSPTNHYFLGSTNTDCFYDVPPSGVYTVTMYRTSGTISQGTLQSGGHIVADSAGSGSMYSGSPECAAIVWRSAGIGAELMPHDIYGTAENPAVWGSYGYTYTTTKLSITNLYDPETNTIGFFPNAPFRFASGIRAAFLGRDCRAYFSGWGYGYSGDINLQQWLVPGGGYLAYTPHQDYIGRDEPYDVLGNNRRVGWIIPEDSYMLSGDTSWFGTMVHSNIFGGSLNYWLRWDPIMDWFYGASWGEFADRWFPRSQFVWTNYVSKCDSTWRTSTNYTTSYVTNRVIGGVTNTITNTTFSTTNYVAAGKVNTYVSEVADSYFGECVGMMFPFERDSPGITRVDANWYAGFSGEPAGKYHPAFWSTNVYRDMGRALSLLQWVKGYRTACDYETRTATFSNGVLVSTSQSVGRDVVSPSISSMGVAIPGSRIRGTEYSATVVKFSITNQTPFTIDSVCFTPESSSATNGVPAAWMGQPPVISSLAPRAEAVTDWWPISPTDMQSWINDNGPDGPALSVSAPYHVYHVQFSAMTNYLNHAPAR